MKTFTTSDFARWGSLGGKKAKHALTPERAREMALKAAAKRGKKTKSK